MLSINLIQKSKFLSLVLRHQPETIDIHLDKNGWANTEELIQKSQASGVEITLEEIQEIVTGNEKNRFEIAETRIRARQGHSISVELNLKEQKPPAILYHGTAEKNLKSILQSGICKRNRHHVHLSSNPTTAEIVGARHGKAVVLEIKTEEMAKDNHRFFLSSNEVWLTDFVPAKFISIQRKTP